jgi:MFS family permease
MQLILLVFGLASMAALAVLVFSIVFGTVLCFTKRFRIVGIFVLLVPPLSALLAVTGSWGATFLCDWLSNGQSLDAAQVWQVLALWSWPIGFALGGIAGAVLGALIAIFIMRKRTSKSKALDVRDHFLTASRKPAHRQRVRDAIF